MSTVPIVQGYTVPADASNSHNKYGQSYGASPGGVVPSSDNNYDLRELRQHPIKQYQDVIWGLFFVAHLAAVVALIAIGLSSGNGFSANSYQSVAFLVGVTGLTAVALSSFALSWMMNNSETLVQVALIFSVLSSLAVGIIGFMMGDLLMGILGLLSFAVGICYAKIVWPRIPFAAVNLKVALQAVRQNMGLTACAYGFTGLAFGWTILWFLGLGDAVANSTWPVVFALFLSYYWVHQVLQNTMQVTTAGTVATWWFVPDEASSWWSTALSDSLYRSTTYSFGSICFGSFLVAFVQALRALEYHARGNDDCNFLVCIIQCILSCIESIIEEINKWAYIYVGMYGFSYLESGRNVIQLFQSKGWTVIITDDLADNVLFMMSVAVGIASGLVGLILGAMDPNMMAGVVDQGSTGGAAFLTGFLAGFLFCSVIMSVVGSAVNTVIVCYAEDPAAFQMNHPMMAREMREAWVQAWPGLVI